MDDIIIKHAQFTSLFFRNTNKNRSYPRSSL